MSAKLLNPLILDRNQQFSIQMEGNSSNEDLDRISDSINKGNIETSIFLGALRNAVPVNLEKEKKCVKWIETRAKDDSEILKRNRKGGKNFVDCKITIGDKAVGFRAHCRTLTGKKNRGHYNLEGTLFGRKVQIYPVSKVPTWEKGNVTDYDCCMRIGEIAFKVIGKFARSGWSGFSFIGKAENGIKVEVRSNNYGLAKIRANRAKKRKPPTPGEKKRKAKKNQEKRKDKPVPTPVPLRQRENSSNLWRQFPVNFNGTLRNATPTFNLEQRLAELSEFNRREQPSTFAERYERSVKNAMPPVPVPQMEIMSRRSYDEPYFKKKSFRISHQNRADITGQKRRREDDANPRKRQKCEMRPEGLYLERFLEKNRGSQDKLVKKIEKLSKERNKMDPKVRKKRYCTLLMKFNERVLEIRGHFKAATRALKKRIDDHYNFEGELMLGNRAVKVMVYPEDAKRPIGRGVKYNLLCSIDGVAFKLIGRFSRSDHKFKEGGIKKRKRFHYIKAKSEESGVKLTIEEKIDGCKSRLFESL